MVYEGKSVYILPQSFIDQMSTLEKMLVIPSKPEVKFSKTYTDSKPYKQNFVDKKTDRHWVKEKTNVTPFKVTVMEVKEGLEKDINDIRKAMNMISKKNFDTQKEIIITFVKIIIDDNDSLVKDKAIHKEINDVTNKLLLLKSEDGNFNDSSYHYRKN